MRRNRLRSPSRVRACVIVGCVACVMFAGCGGGASNDAASTERDEAVAPSVSRALPVGARLPDEQVCAARIEDSRWEPRPENRRQNTRSIDARLPVYGDYDPRWQRDYRPRISGDFRGTTDEIIQWAACKWGLEPDLLRAQAYAESSWRMDSEGDFEPASSGRCVRGDGRDPCPTSFGI